MLAEVTGDFTTRADERTAFESRLGRFSPADRINLQLAFTTAQEAHGQQMRANGEPHFNHACEVAFILMDECKIDDSVIIKAALLHDTLEDTHKFGSPEGKPYWDWLEGARRDMADMFGQETADLDVYLTIPPIDNVTFFTKKQTKKYYYAGLRKGPSKVKLVKAADRLHNLRTQSFTPLEKQKEKVKETREILLPIFERARKDYPEQMDYLIEQIHLELARLEASF